MVKSTSPMKGTPVSLSNTFKKMMNDPKNQQRITQMSQKAATMAKDPKTKEPLNSVMSKFNKKK